MGEIMPYAILALVVLAALVFSVAKLSSRKVVVKPPEEEDLVCRVKFKMSPHEAAEFAAKLSDAASKAASQGAVSVDQYEKGSDRLLRVEIDSMRQ